MSDPVLFDRRFKGDSISLNLLHELNVKGHEFLLDQRGGVFVLMRFEEMGKLFRKLPFLLGVTPIFGRGGI